LTSLAETVELHSGQIRAIADVLKQIMASPQTPAIGFHTIHQGHEDAAREP
jgi:hypothetical protein